MILLPSRAMRRSDFAYELPPELIAQHPLPQRSASRLLCLDGGSGKLDDLSFTALVDLLGPNDLLVLNDTRVIPARLTGRKESGGKVEVLTERILDDRTLLAQVRASKSPKAGTRLRLAEGLEAEVLERRGEFFVLRFALDLPVIELLERHGDVPLPPYIERGDTQKDRDRYQTVYARQAGAVAAPTAGLHFDVAMLSRLQARGIECAYLTLHVGAGTFQPLRVEALEEHRMYSERVEVGKDVCAAVDHCRARGGRVVAVGTTTVRGLEAAAIDGELRPFAGETDIFITPGFSFNVADALVTNFHLSESTLLMLVCAFAGYEHTMHAYRHAVEQHYRFYSYGDAMFITR